MILIRLGRFCRRNPGLAAGLCLLLALAFLGIGGRLLVNVGEARALSAMAAGVTRPWRKFRSRARESLQFWQKRQDRLQPTVPKESTEEPGRK